MSHEIYYTSAPEGLKRGTSGFCTVAASDNIPKPLWDRLETLSAYRHQFAAGAGQNPVSLAHWILSLSGKTHHVLSRICDSGVDHTQRTNAFAHHLVLEHAEIERAPGGPAWMLRQPGVMAPAWDGNVGSIARIGLPAGDDFSASRICRAWEAATGDAGWGGHLADLFARSPARPVCILFSPGQDVFPLVEEAIALLPPAARWNVTFNTYFTSMPTSATCLWRCCLAGTQAAQVALRYAASGLVIDLTDPSRLPALPPGPCVTMARTGQAAEAPRPAALAKPQVRLTPAAAPKPAPPDTEEEDLQAERDRFFDFADVPSPQAEHLAPPDAASAEENSTSAPRPGDPGAGASMRLRHAAPARIMRRAEDALELAEREASHLARRRRRQFMLLFAGALAAIGCGTAVILFLNYRGGPPETPLRRAGPQTPPAATEPVAIHPGTMPEITATASAPGTIAAPTPTTVIAQTSVTPAPPVKTYPSLLTLQTMLERPNIGTGIGDRVQSLALRSADLDPAPVGGLKFAFPPTAAKKEQPAATSTYVHETLGTLTAQAEVRGGKPGINLRWKGSSEPIAEALFIAFDRTAPMLEMRWKSALLLKNPGCFNFIYWTLQNSLIELDAPLAARQRIAWKPFVPAAALFPEPETELKWPIELPRETVAAAPPAEGLPAGWKAEWYPDWESKDPTQRTADNALQVIKFKKPTATAAIDSWFLLTFGPGLKKVTSTYARRLDADKRDLAQFERELHAVEREIEDEKARNNGVVGDSQTSRDRQTRRDQAAALVEAYKAAVAGYNELTGFDIPLGLSDGMQFTTLHFQARADETGK
jgi:hypothetical protein